MGSPNMIKRRIGAELIDAIFAAEGWSKLEGQNRTKMAHDVYDIKRIGNYYVATRK